MFRRPFIFALSAFILLTNSPSYSQTELIDFFTPQHNINTELWYLSHGWSNGEHQSCEWRKNALTNQNDNLLLTLSDKGGKQRPIGCGEIRTKALYSHGRFEVRMKSASGSGLNTAFFTYVGPPHGNPEHDEIDFEFLGKHPRTVDVTYWRDGKQGKVERIDLGFDASQEFHNYAFEWDENAIRWYVDDQLVHQTKEKVELPINDQRIFLSLWSGAKPINDWLGKFTYSEPVHAEVEWVRYTSLLPKEGQP